MVLKVPVVSAVIVLAGSTGTAAYALVALHTANSTDSGNAQPIDDNHKSLSDHGHGSGKQ